MQCSTFASVLFWQLASSLLHVTLAACVVQFAEAVVNLKFDEEPKYQAFMALFDPLCGPQPQRPILTDGQSKALLSPSSQHECPMAG